MLAYWSKKGHKPALLKGVHTSKVEISRGAEGAIYYPATYVGPQVLRPSDDKIIPTDEEKVYAFKIADTLDPFKVKREQPYLYGSPENPVYLPDGKPWVIPKLRISPTGEHDTESAFLLWANSNDLESRYFSDAQGERFVVAENHQEAFALGEVLSDCLFNQRTPEKFHGPKALATLLAINYNCTVYDVGAFGLYSEHNFWNVVVPHAIDVLSFKRYLEADESLKKNS